MYNVTERERRDGGGDRASSQELDTTDELTDKIGSRREEKRKREDIWWGCKEGGISNQ